MNAIEEEESFESLFTSFSNQWQHAQLTHHVSLAASNNFWKLSFDYVPKILELKKAEKLKKKIPQFYQVRKNIYKDICPEVKMTFVFLNLNDGTLTLVKDDHTPLKQYQRNPQYKKLYEEAHIEVNIYIFIDVFY